MSVQNWQAWMALLPCERCGWHPLDCWCRKAIPASTPPPRPQLRILTLDERRAAYASISDTLIEVVAEHKTERQEGAA